MEYILLESRESEFFSLKNLTHEQSGQLNEILNKNGHSLNWAEI